jgi:hypothetical protein
MMAWGVSSARLMKWVILLFGVGFFGVIYVFVMVVMAVIVVMVVMCAMLLNC